MITDVLERSDSITNRCCAKGALGLGLNSEAWEAGKIEALIKTDLPKYLTPEEAKNVGWALFRLGKYGADLVSAVDHDLKMRDAKEMR